MSGEIEQWLEQKKQLLKPGDSVFISKNVVHASFNVGSQPARLMVVLGPCMGEIGYEVVEVADQAPWNSLR
jgi:quercetin dioxygenase-like cupin family protein